MPQTWTRFVVLYVGNLQVVGGPQDASKYSFVVLYVGNLQIVGGPKDASNFVLCSAVCWQPTAWEVPRMPQNWTGL